MHYVKKLKQGWKDKQQSRKHIEISKQQEHNHRKLKQSSKNT